MRQPHREGRRHGGEGPRGHAASPPSGNAPGSSAAPQYQLGSQYYSFPGTEDVPVDLWTYDFGRNRLMRRVRFIDGLIVSIVTLGKSQDD